MEPSRGFDPGSNPGTSMSNMSLSSMLVVPAGVEPASPGPKPEMMDHYTTELAILGGRGLVLTLTLKQSLKYL